jgi:hypothetical protein
MNMIVPMRCHCSKNSSIYQFITIHLHKPGFTVNYFMQGRMLLAGTTTRASTLLYPEIYFDISSIARKKQITWAVMPNRSDSSYTDSYH